jgi:hypothetical protein
MKISAIEGEEGYELYASAIGKSAITILLDGQQVSRVIAADDEAGEVRIVKVDAAGKPEFEVILPKEPWEPTVVQPKEIILTGTVQIIITTE